MSSGSAMRPMVEDTAPIKTTEGTKPTPKAISHLDDAARGALVAFLMNWLAGGLMKGHEPSHLETWRTIAAMFPHALDRPLRLHRIATLPIACAREKGCFLLERPSPGDAGSWTSTLIGLDCVAGVANELVPVEDVETTCRVGITCDVDPSMVIMTFETLRTAFLTLTHDHSYERFVLPPVVSKRKGVTIHHEERFAPYLGNDDTEHHYELSTYTDLFENMPGGPYRQREHVVACHPVEARMTRVYREGSIERRAGHDDPHNFR